TVRLWDLTGATPREKATIQGHDRPVRALAFAPDGKTLASGGEDGFLRLWDPVASPPKKRYEEKVQETIGALVFSPDGKTLAGGIPQSDDKVPAIRLWDLRPPEPIGRNVP